MRYSHPRTENSSRSGERHGIFLYICSHYGTRTSFNQRAGTYGFTGTPPIQSDYLQRRLHHHGICRQNFDHGFLQIACRSRNAHAAGTPEPVGRSGHLYVRHRHVESTESHTHGPRRRISFTTYRRTRRKLIL